MTPRGPGRPARLRRVRVTVLGLLGRPALFALWALALWGTLVGLSLVASALEVGPRGAFAALLPGGDATAWSYLNAATVLLAVLVWSLVAAAVVLGTREP